MYITLVHVSYVNLHGGTGTNACCHFYILLHLDYWGIGHHNIIIIILTYVTNINSITYNNLSCVSIFNHLYVLFYSFFNLVALLF